MEVALAAEPAAAVTMVACRNSAVAAAAVVVPEIAYLLGP